MNQPLESVQNADDARTEYTAIAEFHGALLNSRFTVAGLYVAALGILGNALVSTETSWVIRAVVAAFAMWLTLCLWIIELRTRALFSNIAHRGIDIEHKVWKLVDDNWYSGFFSRQYKEPPGWQDGDNLPRRLNPDRPTLGWASRPLSLKMARLINHSMGLDLLYGGSCLFWLGTLSISLVAVLKGW